MRLVGLLNRDEALEALRALDEELDRLRARGEWSQPLADLRNQLSREICG